MILKSFQIKFKKLFKGQINYIIKNKKMLKKDFQ